MIITARSTVSRLSKIASHMASASTSASSAALPVYLVGAGLVGKQVLHQLALPHLQSKLRVDIVSNSRFQLHLSEQADRSAVEQYLQALPSSSSSSTVSENDNGPFKLSQMDLQEFVKSLSGRGIFVDCTSSQAVAELYPEVLKNGLSIVTPNKKAFSSSQQLYQAIQAARSSTSLIYQESTVGAGLPIIGTLNDLVNTGDEIHKIEGVLSGTLSYIFNEFSQAKTSNEGEQPRSFSSIVKVAKENGYTEPHPADDLSGSDVARKLCILSRLVPSLPELSKGFESVPTETLIPGQLANIATGEEFVSRLPEFDAHYEKMRKEAADAGQVLRYVGVIDAKNNTVKCGLERYSFSHPFASSLGGSDNIISFTSARYSKRPLIVQGSGAGADVTAMGVVADCIRVAERLL